MDDATEIAERLLFETGEAMLAGDFDAFAQHFALPYEMETVEGKQLIETRAGLRLVFDAVHAHLNRQRVTLLARHCVSACFRDQNELATTHETRLISHGILVQEPYPSFSLVQKDKDGKWKITFTSYVIYDSSDLNAALNAKAPETES